MSHWPIVPILIPLLAAIAMLLAPRSGIAAKRVLSIASAAALSLCAVYLLILASNDAVRVYRLGDWPAPYGIVLVLDRLAAIMVALTAALALAAVLAATSGADTLGRHFHVFLQLQIAGLNGAFLTGDLFNLFVFFEVLLLASYALLVHGGGLERARARRPEPRRLCAVPDLAWPDLRQPRHAQHGGHGPSAAENRAR
jgi:multicomponent K+:H+ antiporter subunit D